MFHITVQTPAHPQSSIPEIHQLVPGLGQHDVLLLNSRVSIGDVQAGVSGLQHRGFVVARLGAHSCGDRESIIRYFLTGDVVGGEREGDKQRVLSTVSAMKKQKKGLWAFGAIVTRSEHF